MTITLMLNLIGNVRKCCPILKGIMYIMNDQNESKYVYVNSIYLNVLIRSSFFKPPVFCIKQKTFEFSNKTVDRKEPL